MVQSLLVNVEKVLADAAALCASLSARVLDVLLHVRQDFGNFQDMEGKEREKTERLRFGRFFYRFPNGESGAGAHSARSSVMQTTAHAECIAAGRQWQAGAPSICVAGGNRRCPHV